MKDTQTRIKNSVRQFQPGGGMKGLGVCDTLRSGVDHRREKEPPKTN